MSKNKLKAETSEYLLQHKDNPVHWWAWGDEAFIEAKKQNKPVLLSVGYAACHWCHVMAHECFEDADVAQVMNDLFICIKLDREERPDIDKIYMTALHNLGEQGGWPLNMFLTPEGKPFWGGTYYPKEPKYGRPGFVSIIKKVSDVFHNEPEKVKQNTEALKESLEAHKLIEDSIAPEIKIERILSRLIELMDEEKGGPKGAPKFPQCALLYLFWLGFQKLDNARYKNFVLTSLTQMCQGGIYDHLGGGFSRYSVDNRWLVPHFEKMIYDNAQLISLMSKSLLSEDNCLFRERIEETVGWLVREMSSKEGAFYASLDADSEGQEGKYYIWQKEEVINLLPPELADSFVSTYDVDSHGNWEGKTILNRLNHLSLKDTEQEGKLQEARKILFKEREKRIRPGLDDKILADWNGLLISALCEASIIMHKPNWLAFAENAFGFIEKNLHINNRLAHSYAKGCPRHPAMLDDYAFMIKAALSLYEITRKKDYLIRANEKLIELNDAFWSDDYGAYFMSSDKDQLLFTRLLSASDEATPAGNGLMIENLVRLYSFTGDETFMEMSERIIKRFQSRVAENIFAHSTYVAAKDFFENFTEIIIFPSSKNNKPEDLIAETLRLPIHNKIVDLYTENVELESHPAYGKGSIDDKDTFFVCQNRTCSAPFLSLEALKSQYEIVSEPNR